ncbi:MAG: hypothetical protein K1X64_13255, partial [Myxococcaceae bacterium]|nr:hypothetical protein [Myxococcaceae bacterium]
LGSALTLEIPQGAVSRRTLVTVSEVSAARNEREFELEPHDLQLQVPAQLIVDASSEMELSHRENERDVRVENQVHEANHLRAELHHLGRIKLHPAHADDDPQTHDAAELDGGSHGDGGVDGGTLEGDTCWDGTSLPRPALEPTPTASVADKFSAWQKAMNEYQVAAAAFSAAAKEHADAYNAAAQPVAGKSCHQNADCDTGSLDFPGACRVYYEVGQCVVQDNNPIGSGPAAPAQPDLSCADFTCSDSSYQCEQEASTQGIACILQRCGRHGGGGK